MTAILVVEDEGIVAQDIQTRLKNLGYAVPSVVSSGEGAIKKVEKDSPDLILMDIVLKGEMDGIEAANHIRNHYDIPVVYLTAYADEKTLNRAKMSAPYGFIVKPFEDTELHAIIETALYKHEIEKKVRESEQWLSTLLSSIQDGVIAANAQGEITFMNGTAEMLTGWKSKAAAGRPLDDIFVISGEADEQSALVERVLHKKDSIRAADQLLLTEDGREILVDYSATPIKNDKKAIMGVVLVFRDITGQKRTEELLKRSEKKFRDLFDNASDAVFIHDLDGHILEVNKTACERLGYSRKELLQLTPMDIDSPEYAVLVLERIDELKKGDRLFFETAHITKDGRKIPIELSSRIIEYEGNPVVLSIARDISERKKAEEELRRIAWLMTKSVKPESAEKRTESVYEQPYGNLAELNTYRLLADSVGEDVLTDIMSNYLNLLDTSAAIYEKNGDYALGTLASDWCRFLDQASRNLRKTDDNKEALDSGMWHCHESCWKEASKVSMELGQPADIPCRGGIRIYALPIWAQGEIVGSINFGYGDPPEDLQKLEEIAERYNVPVEELAELAESYESRPPFMIELAKNSLMTSAQLIGTLVEKKLAEEEKTRILQGLNERVKELSCLYHIDEVEKKEDITVEELLSEAVRIIPPSFQYPDVTGCCITFEDEEYTTENFTKTKWMEKQAITVGGRKVGCVEVCYLGKNPEDDSPFLKDESELIISVAQRLGEFIERKNAQEALLKSEEKYRDLVENLNEVIYIIDEKGVVTYISPAVESFIGYCPREVIGHHFKEFVYQKDLPRLKENFERIFSDHIITANEYRVLDKSGRIHWMRTSSRPILEGNLIVGVQGVLADITEQKQAELQLKDLFEASKQINSTMNLDEIFRFTSDAVQELVGFDNFVIFLVTEGRKKIYPAYTSKEMKNLMEGLIFHYGEGSIGRCIKSKTPFFLDNHELGSEGMKSKIVIPLVIENECVGALYVSTSTPDAYDQKAVAVLMLLSETISSAIRNSKLHSQVWEFGLELEGRVKEKSRRIAITLDAKHNLQKQTSWEKGLQIIVQYINKLGFERCGVFLVNPMRKALDFHFGEGKGLPQRGTSISLRDTEYYGVKCVREKKTIHVRDSKEGKGKQIVEAHSFVWVPIIVQDEAFAAITAGSERGEITEEDVKDLEILAGMCAAFIDRTRISVEPAAENALKTKMKYWLDSAECYIVTEKKPEKSFEIFVDLVTHGITGFVISRQFPERIKRRYELQKIPVVWLTRSEIENTLNPDDLAKLIYIVDSFARKNGESVILLDGLEYLITQTGFDPVLKCVYELKDIVVSNDSRLIIPLHTGTVGQEEYSILEREFTILESE